MLLFSQDYEQFFQFKLKAWLSVYNGFGSVIVARISVWSVEEISERVFFSALYRLCVFITNDESLWTYLYIHTRCYNLQVFFQANWI